MRASAFNISVSSQDESRLLLFNTLRGSLTNWEQSEIPLVRRFLSEGAFTPTTQAHEAFLQNMLDLGYAIDDDCDEIEILRKRKIAGMTDPNRLDVIIMPNMACNFACPYCYEAHENGSNMSDEVRQRIIAFLKAQIPRFRVVLISWFGGEPLLSVDTVVAISTVARNLCRKHNVAFVANVTSNGYLLDPRKANALVQCGILNYQITVDGPPESHNRTRRLRDGRGTFQQVFENITTLVRTSAEVRISLRVNFNHENIDSIPELLKLFSKDIRPSLRVVFEPIFGDHCLSATANIRPHQISDKLSAHYSLARELGYDVTMGELPVGQLVYCYAERENQFIFNHAGDVFKCSVCKFSSSERFGYLCANGSVAQEGPRWQDWFGIDLFDEKCCSCTYLPLCMGGCRRARLEDGETGSYCKLVPTNASYTLKSIFFGRFDQLLRQSSQSNEVEAIDSNTLKE